MTEDELSKLQALCDAATTAPWAARIDMDEGWLVCSLGNSSDDGNDWHVMTAPMSGSECTGDAKTDAAFIAAARTAVPALIAEARRLQYGLGLPALVLPFQIEANQVRAERDKLRTENESLKVLNAALLEQITEADKRLESLKAELARLVLATGGEHSEFPRGAA